MTPERPDPWLALAGIEPSAGDPLARLERALARSEELRVQVERVLEDCTRDLYLANERLSDQGERLLRAERLERARLSRELELAQAIQAALLPCELAVAGLDIAAVMVPCAEMGGDYYDIRAVADGCWIGIGDVSGHGVSAGLVMLMLQSTVAALTLADPDAPPSRLLAGVNRVLHDNIRTRMGSADHVTATLLRWHGDGRVVFAGAHEDLVVLRAATGACETFATHGAWLGVVPDIGRGLRDDELRLAPGDTLLLYTDGLTEAFDEAGQAFGLERVCAALAAAPCGPAQLALDGLLAALRGFSGRTADDVTALVVRCVGRQA